MEEFKLKTKFWKTVSFSFTERKNTTELCASIQFPLDTSWFTKYIIKQNIISKKNDWTD